MKKLINIYDDIQDKSMTFEEFVEWITYTYYPEVYADEVDEILS
jgi:hypothetical protein